VLLPAIQYGDWPTVKRRMGKVVTQLKRGAGLIELMTKDGMLDTNNYPCDGVTTGMIVIRRSILGSVHNFHCFAPWMPAEEPLRDLRTDLTVPSAAEEAMFAASLQTPWGVLGLLAPDNTSWVWPRERHQPFLKAALAFWDELDAVGPRYYWTLQAERLWPVANSLHYVLGNMGVPNDVLRAPLPPEGPRGLLRYARPVAQA
jgi:hypothetical protein